MARAAGGGERAGDSAVVEIFAGAGFVDGAGDRGAGRAEFYGFRSRDDDVGPDCVRILGGVSDLSG